jgi:hypothetical protein
VVAPTCRNPGTEEDTRGLTTGDTNLEDIR